MSALILTPRLKPLSPRRSAVLSVLDVGGSKVVCLIARLLPMEQGATLRGRTHRCKVMGLGQQRSRGVKGGAIVDLDAAESAIRGREPGRLDQVRLNVETCGQPQDRAGVLWNVGLEQDDSQHRRNPSGSRLYGLPGMGTRAHGRVCCAASCRSGDTGLALAPQGCQ